MVHPAIIAAAVMGGSSLLGGIMRSGSQSSGADYGAQLNMNRWYANTIFKDKMALAKQYGIHPLQMLGVNMAQGRAVPVGQQGTDYGLSRAGQAAGQALARMDLEIYRAKKANIEAQTRMYDRMYINGQPDSTLQEGNIFGKSGNMDLTRLVRPQIPTAENLVNGGVREAGMRAFSKQGVDEYGNVWTGPNREVEDPQENMPDYHVYRILRRWIWDYPKQLSFHQTYNVNTNAAKIHRNSIRKYINHLGPAGKGMVYRWNHRLGMPVRCIDDGKNYLYKYPAGNGLHYYMKPEIYKRGNKTVVPVWK